ncbi:MAG: outer membrane beta-barrel protein [Bacteroidota bacterium]
MAHYATLYAKIQAKKGFSIELFNNYNSPYQFQVVEAANQFYTNLTLQQNILKGQGLLRFTCNDIFNTLRDKNIARYQDFDVSFYQKRITRNYSLTFIYRFSNKGSVQERSIEKNRGSRNRL